MRTRPIAIAASLALAALLAGCTGGGGTGGGATAPADPVGGDSGGGPGAADCVVGDWSADVDDMAAQLLAFYGENGLPATETDADGTILLSIAGDGTARVTQDVTIQVDGNLNGAALTIIQHHSGEGSGGWSIDDDSLQFPEWNEGTLVIDQEILLDGQAFDLPIELPESQFGGTLHVDSCGESSMTTSAAGSPFTTTWVRT